MIREGVLFFDRESGRYDAVFEDGSYYDGLHCGEPFDVWLDGKWHSTRIEYSSKTWYLIGLSDIRLDGRKIRI